jgi:hypothetical protein
LPQSYTAQVKTQKTTDETNSSQKLTGRAKPQIKGDKNISNQHHGYHLQSKKYK